VGGERGVWGVERNGGAAYVVRAPARGSGGPSRSAAATARAAAASASPAAPVQPGARAPPPPPPPARSWGRPWRGRCAGGRAGRRASRAVAALAPRLPRTGLGGRSCSTAGRPLCNAVRAAPCRGGREDHGSGGLLALRRCCAGPGLPAARDAAQRRQGAHAARRPHRRRRRPRAQSAAPPAPPRNWRAPPTPTTLTTPTTPTPPHLLAPSPGDLGAPMGDAVATEFAQDVHK
jgi:hypothetical protein